MIRASISGRLRGDPVERTTRNDQPMTTVSVAVNVARSSEDAVTEWVGVVAFGGTGELLARNRKGDLVEAMGTLTRSTFTDREGNGRASWSLTAEAILSVRTSQNDGPERVARAAEPGRPSLYLPPVPARSGPPLPANRVDDLWPDGGVP